MFGGTRVGAWRQCNSVIPAVTAAQTGTGQHNGIALTIRAVDGADIDVIGPRYQSYFYPGTSGSQDDAPPAEITIIPEYTSSFMYGAVNRNDAATAWTAAAQTSFALNTADSVNSAAYGTFFYSTPGVGGAPTIPCQSISVSGTGGSPVVINLNWATNAGNTIVVCVQTSGTGSNPTITGMLLGGSAGNFAKAAGLNNNAAYNSEIWYDPDCAGGQTTVTAAFTTVTSPYTNFTVYEVTGTLVADTGTAAAVTTASTSWGSGNTTATTQANEIWFGSVATAQLPTPDSCWATSGPSEASYWTDTGYQIVTVTGPAAFSGTQSPAGVSTSAVATFYLAGGTGSVAYTTAGVPVTVGASNGDGTSGTAGGIVALEIPSAGVPVTEDPSSPSPVWTAAGTSVTAAHFCPPMGALLVAMVAAAGGAGVTVSDDNGALTWVQQAFWASGTSGYAGIWTAVVVCG